MQDAVTSSFLTIPGLLKGPDNTSYIQPTREPGGMGPQPSSGRPATRQGLAVQPEAGRGRQRPLETKGRLSSSLGKGSLSAHLMDSNSSQGRKGHVQGGHNNHHLCTCPRPGTPWVWGFFQCLGRPLGHANPPPPPLRDERERWCNTV